ncbi:MAG: hypothetical protein HZB43_09430 [candidate division Zixibacteria bacterium]|nr:hypothetical protein [candidate division Zixibacteria bacterium]
MTKTRFDKAQLLQVLAEEASFYRALDLLIDRQRDGLSEDSDVRMCDLFAEIGRVQRRIENSEQIIQSVRKSDPKEFSSWMQEQDVRGLLDQITGLVTHSQGTINECIQIARAKRTEFQRELGQMDQGRRLYASMSPPEGGPRFLDARH